MASNRQNVHTLPSAICFFKIITKTSLEDGKLRIPKGFTSKCGGNMPNPLFLKAPNGKEWNIYWTKNDGDIWFQKGWKQFSTYYSLDHGHMVLFEYQEASHFVIHIFDKSTLEIEYHFHGSQDEHNNLHQINEESVEILDEVPQSKKIRVKSPMSCPQPLKKLRTDKSENGGKNSKLQIFSNVVRVKEDNDGSTKCVKVEQEELTSNITEALCRDSNFRAKNPSFTFVMKPCYLYNTYLHVPSQFANKYLKKGQSDILLQVLDGRTWPSKYCLGRISNGWKKFVLDNNLEVRDVCVFELTSSEALTFKVTIFRLGEQSCSPPPQVSIQEVNPLDPARTPDVEIKTTTPNEDEKATQRTSPETSEAGEEANKFTSENPFFVINIGPKQRGRVYRPYIPSSFTKKYLHKMQIVMLQLQKDLWFVKLDNYPRRSTARLSRGWYMFMKETKLQVGDACVFELINKEDAVLDVHIFRGN